MSQRGLSPPEESSKKRKARVITLAATKALMKMSLRPLMMRFLFIRKP